MSTAVSWSLAARTRLSTCSIVVALEIGAVTPGLAMTQASATSAGLASWRADTASRGGENALSSRIQILADAAAARAFAEIGLAAVLSGKETAGEGIIGDDADLLAHAEVAQRPV